jgi:Amt family ammonium transporter
MAFVTSWCDLLRVCVQIFDGVCWLFLKLRIDDPLSAAPMHAFGGMWGIFFTGLLAKQEYVEEAYGRSEYYGAFYGSKGNLLASQVSLLHWRAP